MQVKHLLPARQNTPLEREFLLLPLTSSDSNPTHSLQETPTYTMGASRQVLCWQVQPQEKEERRHQPRPDSSVELQWFLGVLAKDF